MWALVQFSNETYDVCKVKDVETKNEEAIVRYRGSRYAANVLAVNANTQELLKLKEKLEGEHQKKEENEAIPNAPVSISANDNAADNPRDVITLSHESKRIILEDEAVDIHKITIQNSPTIPKNSSNSKTIQNLSPHKLCSGEADNPRDVITLSHEGGKRIILEDEAVDIHKITIQNSPTIPKNSSNSKTIQNLSPHKLCSGEADNPRNVITLSHEGDKPIILEDEAVTKLTKLGDNPRYAIALSHEGGNRIILEDEAVDIHKLTIQNSPTKIWQFSRNSSNSKTVHNFSPHKLHSGEEIDTSLLGTANLLMNTNESVWEDVFVNSDDNNGLNDRLNNKEPATLATTSDNSDQYREPLVFYENLELTPITNLDTNLDGNPNTSLEDALGPSFTFRMVQEVEDENDVAILQNEPRNSDDGSEYFPEIDSSDESPDEQNAVSNATKTIHKNTAESFNSTDRFDSPQIANVVGHSAPDDQEMFVMTVEAGTKRDYCLYCHTMQAKLSRHVVRRHRGQEDVAEYLSYPVGSDERKKLMAAIRKKANFAFNTNQNLNTGERKVARRPTEKSGKSAIDFATCPACLGDYAKDSLRHHVRRCEKRCTGRRDILIGSKKVTGRIHREASNILRQNVFPTMQEDEVVRAIRYDELVTRYGNKLCQKYKDPHFYDMIRQKLRQLGRFLLEFRKHAKDILTFYDVFLPKNYDATVITVRMLAGLNASETGFHAPSLATSLGTMLKQVGQLCISEYIKQQNKDKQILAEDYLKLLIEDYPTSISRTVMETNSQQSRQKKITLPSFEDIRKLQVYLRSGLEKNYNLLREEFSLSAWLNLGSFILVLLQLFNRRRPGETERVLIKDFENYQKIDDSNTGEQYTTFSIKEKEAAQKYVRFTIRGKLNRTVPILMHRELLVCTQQLLSMRNLAKVDKNNPYIFGIPGRVGGHFKYLRSCQLLRRYAVECGAEKPETLRATILRKHAATVCAHMDLTDRQISDLAKFLGHGNDIHRAIYRQPPIVADICHVSKLLEVVEGKARNIVDDSSSEEETTSLIPTVTDTHEENNCDLIPTSSRQDLTIESIADFDVASKKRKTRSTSPYGPCKRVRWTMEEKNIILKEFKENIETKKLPSLRKIQEIVDQNQVLTKRNLPSIKTWIANQFKKNA